MDTPLGSVLYITLGCAKNEVDTDRMRSLLTAAGYEEAFDPQDADIAIVNTCSFLASRNVREHRDHARARQRGSGRRSFLSHRHVRLRAVALWR